MKKKKRLRAEGGTSVVDELRELLAIDKHSLDDEIQKQPQLFFKVSEAQVSAAARRDYLKEEIKRVDAELHAKHRRLIEKTGSRATDAAVTAAIQADPDHQRAVDAHINAAKEADLLVALKESFSQRSYMLRDLATLFVANYFESSSMKANSAASDIRYEKAKDKMAEARKKARDK